MAEDMAEVLKELRERFMNRHLLPPAQAAEQEMTRNLTRVLREAHILTAYKRNVILGTEEFQVPFAFAHMTSAHRADRALRPLNFDLATPTEIYNYGDQWIKRLQRLEGMGYRPEKSLFALRAPREKDDLRAKAFAEIRHELITTGFAAPTEEETAEIVEFARIPENPNLKLAS